MGIFLVAISVALLGVVSVVFGVEAVFLSVLVSLCVWLSISLAIDEHRIKKAHKEAEFSESVRREVRRYLHGE